MNKHETARELCDLIEQDKADNEKDNIQLVIDEVRSRGGKFTTSSNDIWTCHLHRYVKRYASDLKELGYKVEENMQQTNWTVFGLLRPKFRIRPTLFRLVANAKMLNDT